jgi:hypothetical protein
MNDELMNVIIFGFVLVVIVAVLLITPPGHDFLQSLLAVLGNTNV